MFRPRLALVLALLLASSAAASAALEVVFVVRHAQKDEGWSGDGRLKPLSDKGARCAAHLAATLRGRSVAAVYATETARTLATGAAVSGVLEGVEVIGDDRTAAPTAEWVSALRERHAGDRAILVVGHSNTVDDLVLAWRPDASACLEALGLARPGIPESRYGDLWILNVTTDQPCRGVNRRPLGQLGPNDEDDCSTP